MNDSRLFYRLLHFQIYREYSVNQLYFYIMGYQEKGIFDNCTEFWIYEFLSYINLKTSKIFLNIDYPSSKGYAGIITDFQKSNQDGLDIFYDIFYEFCELKIPNFRDDLSKYHAKATIRLPSDT